MDQEIVTGTGVSEIVATQPTVDVVEIQPAPKKIKDLSPEERTEYERVSRAERRKRTAEKKQVEGLKYNSRVEVTKQDALELLRQRIQNPHVVDVAYGLALKCADATGVFPNRFYFAHGYQQLIESQQAKSEVFLDIQPEEVEGEVLHRTDLHALWDYGFWRQPDISFEQWLADRRKFKSSAFELSKLLGKEDFGKKHEEWTSFAPRWNPVGLRPGYTQKQALTWLDAQSEIKRFLLVASRNSMKSTWARILALTLTITYPDARILIVSETNRLSKKAMKEFRGYLEAAPNSPTLFQQYFGEFTIAPDEGQSLIYDNPLAHLGLPQNSVESSSMESANTGSRFDFCIFDDPISRDNGTGNEDQKAAAISKHGSIMKLREPAGYAINIQTPWEVEDLGDVMIKRNEEDPERPLAVRIDPVMEIRPEAVGTPLLKLTEADVILNFLPKLNWKFVRDEMRSPEGINFFRTQYMTEWVRDDDQIKVTFTIERLRGAVHLSNPYPDAQRVMRVCALDSAFSVARTADFSCLITADVLRHRDMDYVFVHDVKLERMKTSELGVLVAETLNRMRPDRVIAERTGDWVSLQDSIRRAAMLRGYILPDIFWKPVSNVAGASLPVKAARAKGMEPLLADGRLLFSAGIPILESCFAQMTHFDGIKRSGSSPRSKDDFVDALSLLVATFGPREAAEPISEAQQEFERQIYEQAVRKGDYDRIFGTPVAPQQQTQVYTPPPEEDENPLMATLGRYGMLRRQAA